MNIPTFVTGILAGLVSITGKLNELAHFFNNLPHFKRYATKERLTDICVFNQNLTILLSQLS